MCISNSTVSLSKIERSIYSCLTLTMPKTMSTWLSSFMPFPSSCIKCAWMAHTKITKMRKSISEKISVDESTISQSKTVMTQCLTHYFFTLSSFLYVLNRFCRLVRQDASLHKQTNIMQTQRKTRQSVNLDSKI